MSKLRSRSSAGDCVCVCT